MGDPLTGKTAITQMFMSDGGKFPKAYSLTFSIDISSKIFSIPGENADSKVQFVIYDTSGHDIYTDVVKKCIKNCDVLLLVYDVTSESSFENLKEWIQLFSETNAAVSKPIFLFGNKSDLHNRRTVYTDNSSKDEMMKKFGISSAVEGSAKNYEGVHEVFTSMAQYLLK
ncbi:Hypothetical predicted protein [Cloeon dipterum]|uniref:Uncharacterized protein n=1 Tax=Cloeon dipterum TaxID=197152 RepID=A0A8S1E721_9INSE|nr:Hypothetical predicted protein [Cloeon dipterum]